MLDLGALFCYCHSSSCIGIWRSWIGDQWVVLFFHSLFFPRPVQAIKEVFALLHLSKFPCRFRRLGFCLFAPCFTGASLPSSLWIPLCPFTHCMPCWFSGFPAACGHHIVSFSFLRCIPYFWVQDFFIVGFLHTLFLASGWARPSLDIWFCGDPSIWFVQELFVHLHALSECRTVFRPGTYFWSCGDRSVLWMCRGAGVQAGFGSMLMCLAWLDVVGLV